MREPLPHSIAIFFCGPLTCRHQKDTRCLLVCVVKRLQLREQQWLRFRGLPPRAPLKAHHVPLMQSVEEIRLGKE